MLVRKVDQFRKEKRPRLGVLRINRVDERHSVVEIEGDLESLPHMRGKR